jgi:hypothetical protein
MMDSVVKEIEQMGCEWDIITGGCTGLAQPIDVGIGKPFKNRMRYKWEEMMVNDEEGGADISLKAPETRKMIAEWAVCTWGRIPKEQVYNSWRHGEHSYFPDEPTLQTTFVDEEEFEDMDEEDRYNQEEYNQEEV